jgi:hypothetical protein
LSKSISKKGLKGGGNIEEGNLDILNEKDFDIDSLFRL